jgi:hypothetical protein
VGTTLNKEKEGSLERYAIINGKEYNSSGFNGGTK